MAYGAHRYTASPILHHRYSEQMQAIADDWHHELRCPAWAISNACRWWMGRHNDKRRYKPMAGDIAERCQYELGVVRLAEVAVRKFDRS